MKNQVILIFRVLASIVSAILLILSFHPYQVYWLAWIALVPLLVAMSGRSLKAGFLLSCLCMMIFFAVVFAFTLQIPAYTLFHHVILDLYLGPLYGFFGIFYMVFRKKWGTAIALIGTPFVWVCLEYIRVNFGPLGFPWVLLAYSQYTNLPMIQVASIAGAYGVSFLIVTVNAGFAAAVLLLTGKMRLGRMSLDSNPRQTGMAAVVMASTFLLVSSWIYGKRVLSGEFSGQRIKTSMIQGNIAQRDKWDRRQARAIMQTYADLTTEASQERPDLIIWPETATPRSITIDLSLRKQVVRIARESGSWLLLGSSERQKFETGRKADLQFYNTAFLIPTSPGTAIQRYEKIHLFPFGEYLPWQGIFPWSVLNVENAGNYLPGKTYTVFTCGDFRFGVTICWEILYPGLSRISIRDGAQVMVNITNEAWFGKTIAPYLVVTGAVFRAIENRVFIARCANTSLSCFIDPHGRIVDQVVAENGEELFVRGVLTSSIVPMDANTPYTRYGNWLVWLSMGGVGFAVLWRKNLVQRSSGRIQGSRNL